MNVASTRARLVLPLLIVWTFAITTLRAVRIPNDFATAHWLIDYRFGLIKRGLVGSFMSLASAITGRAPTEGVIVAFSFGLLAATGVALLYLLLRVAGDGRSRTAGLVALAGACSPWVVMHAHLTGYFDGLVTVLTILAVHLVLRGRMWPGAALMGAAILVHEIALLVALPAFLLAVRRANLSVVRAAALPLAVFAVVAVSPYLQPAGQWSSAMHARLATAGFLGGGMDQAVPTWLSDSFLENLRQCADGIWQRAIFAVAPLMTAPAVLALAWLAALSVRRRIDRLMVAAVCVLPQAVHLFAWDAPRIWTWSILAALLSAWVTSETADPSRKRNESQLLRIVALSAIVAGACFTIPLMDGQYDRLAGSVRVLLYLPTLAGAAWLLSGRSDFSAPK